MAQFSIRFLFRAVGLGVLTTLYNIRYFSYSTVEPKKYIARESFWVALQRCMVHLLPSTASIVVIALNLKGFFIGFELAGIPGHDPVDMAALQLTAKLQELLIIASIGTIVYHRIRHDLLNSRGLPFGLLGSGLSFTQISYLWSPEFIGALSCNSHWMLYGIILLSGIIASTAGPATAVLLIPRTISFPVGYSDYYINGTADHLWPTYIGLDKYLPNYTNAHGEAIDCASNYGYTSAVCPSGGYLSLLNHFSAGTMGNRGGIATTSSQTPGIFAQSVRGGILVQSPRGQVAPQTLSGLVRNEDISETYSYATHGATTNLQMQLNYDWYLAAQDAEFMYPINIQVSRYRFYAVQQTSVQSQAPAVRVLCHQGQNLPVNSTTVEFPSLPEYEVSISVNGTTLHTHEVDVSSLADMEPSNKTRITWHDFQSALPPGDSVTYGLILEAPWYNKTSRIVSGCSIDARWAQSTVWARFPGPFQATFSHTRQATGGFRRTSFLPANDSSWRRILFDQAWLNAVDFEVPESAPGHTSNGASAVEAMIEASGILSNTTDLTADNGTSASIRHLEYVIASVLSDAISRAGSFRSYNITGRVDEWPFLFYNASPHSNDILRWSRALRPPDYSPSNYTRMRTDQTVTGYGYQASTSSDYLSLLVLFTHLLIALMHTIYVLFITHRTSGCWDTFSELLVLAQQSAPAKEALQNTCAGIERLSTFKHRVRIKVSDSDANHLELDFGSDDEFDEPSEVKFSVAYGGFSGVTS